MVVLLLAGILQGIDIEDSMLVESDSVRRMNKMMVPVTGFPVVQKKLNADHLQK
jgi:hypothetical protein